MLAAMFVIGRCRRPPQPGAKVPGGRPGRRRRSRRSSRTCRRTPSSWSRLNGAVQVGAGLHARARAGSRGCRSALLAGSLVPTTLAGHRFWEEKDPEKRGASSGSSSSRTSACSAGCCWPRSTPRASPAWPGGPSTPRSTRRPAPGVPGAPRGARPGWPPTRPGRTCPADRPTGPAAHAAAATTLAAMIEPWPAPRADAPGATPRCALPGSKSLTNRSLVLAALARAPTHAARPAASAATPADGRRAARARGTDASRTTAGDWLVTPGPLPGPAAVDVGHAGTVMRFLPPVAALADGDVPFDGDPRARERPMAPMVARAARPRRRRHRRPRRAAAHRARQRLAARRQRHPRRLAVVAVRHRAAARRARASTTASRCATTAAGAVRRRTSTMTVEMLRRPA